MRCDELESFLRESDLGMRLMRNVSRVRREVPFTIRVDATRIDPAFPAPGEFLLFQGIVDLVFYEASTRKSQDDRLVLLDFKTDWWDGTTAHFERLDAMYRPQIWMYCAGIEQALGRVVDESWLCFLRARQPWQVDAPRDRDEWLKYVGAAALGEMAR